MDIGSLVNDALQMYEISTNLYNSILLDYQNSADMHQHAIEKLNWRENYIADNTED